MKYQVEAEFVTTHRTLKFKVIEAENLIELEKIIRENKEWEDEDNLQKMELFVEANVLDDQGNTMGIQDTK